MLAFPLHPVSFLSLKASTPTGQFALTLQAAPPPTDREEMLRQAAAAGGPRSRTLSCSESSVITAGRPPFGRRARRPAYLLMSNTAAQKSHRFAPRDRTRREGHRCYGNRRPGHKSWGRAAQLCGASLLMHFGSEKLCFLSFSGLFCCFCVCVTVRAKTWKGKNGKRSKTGEYSKYF